MSEIRAFVGHSFSEDDETLNKTFLDYFDQIGAMGIGFIWDHAKVAKPKELAEKVINLIRDRGTGESQARRYTRGAFTKRTWKFRAGENEQS